MNTTLTIFDLIFFVILIIFLVPYIQRRFTTSRRLSLIKKLEESRGSRVITLIQRQETMSLLGFPITRYIDIEDSEQLLRAIRLTPDDMPIDLVLHTPGGLVLASEQIACALKRHPGKVSILIPHYAMSGGTLIALAADEIIMDEDAVLGPVDPQLGSAQFGSYPAASILKALEEPNPNRNDETLILGDMAKKATNQVYETVYNLVKGKMPEEKAKELARTLSEGRWTHDYPINTEKALEIGLPVKTGLPKEVYKLMELYPQAGQRRPSVEFVPTPYTPPATKPQKGKED